MAYILMWLIVHVAVQVRVIKGKDVSGQHYWNVMLKNLKNIDLFHGNGFITYIWTSCAILEGGEVKACITHHTIQI